MGIKSDDTAFFGEHVIISYLLCPLTYKETPIPSLWMVSVYCFSLEAVAELAINTTLSSGTTAIENQLK